MTISYEITSIKILSAPPHGEVCEDTSPEPLAGERERLVCWASGPVGSGTGAAQASELG